MRAPLAKATSIAELNNAVADQVQRISAHPAVVNLKGADLEIAREFSEGVLRGLEHSPSTRLDSVLTYGVRAGRPRRPHDGGNRDYAHSANADKNPRLTHISLNVKWASDPNEIPATLAKAARPVNGIRDSSFADAGPMGLGIHEFGHIAASQVPKTHERPVTDYRGREIGRELMDIVYEAYAAVRARLEKLTGNPQGNSQMGHRDLTTQQISTYASWAGDELLAEAFADVVVHGGKATDLSKEIYSMVVRGTR